MQPEERDAASLWDMLQASRDVLECAGLALGRSGGEYRTEWVQDFGTRR